MRFEINVHDREIISLVERFVRITGEDPWVRKFTILQRQGAENRYLRHWQEERNGIELKFGELLARQFKYGRFPIKIQDEKQYELYGFVAGIVRMHERLSPAGQKRLAGMLRDGLQPDNNLLSLQHEVTTAVHLVSRGYDVQMNDLERGAGVDFIASKGDLEIEVECKMFTGDLGRKIHRRKVLMLHHHLAKTIQDVYKRADKGLLIRITLPDRLTCQPSQLRAIESTVVTALLSGTAVIRNPECEVQVSDFNVSESPFKISKIEQLSEEAVRAFADKQFGRSNRELMILFSPNKRAVVVQMESAHSDEVLKGAHRQLREAAKGQFTKTRPGILAIQFQELTAEEMLDIGRSDSSVRGNATALQIMTSDFLNSANRAHIHTVAYRSQGKLMVRDEAHGQTITSEGPTYYIRNPNNPYYNDSRAQAFGLWGER